MMTTRILYIGKNDADRGDLEQAAERWSGAYELKMANGPTEAGKFLSKDTFGLVILGPGPWDDRLPGMIGNIGSVPFITLGVPGDVDSAVRAMRLGASDHLVKDGEGKYLEDLPSSIERVLDERRRRSEREEELATLRESEEMYRDQFENANVLMYSLSPGGRFLYVNNTWLKKMEYTPEEVKQLHLRDIMDPDHVEYCMSLFKKIRAGAHFENVSTVFVSKSGRKQYMEGSVSANIRDGTFIGTRSIFRDVTAKILAEEALKDSEKKFKKFFESQPEYCYMVSTEGTILDINVAALEVLGKKKSDVLGRSFITTVYEEHSAEKMKVFFETWKRTGTLMNKELRIRSADGKPRTVLLNMVAVRDRNDDIIHSITIQRDITEKIRFQHELARSEGRYRSLVENLQEGLGVLDLDGKLIMVNQAFSEILGYSEGELDGRIISELICPEVDGVDPGGKSSIGETTGTDDYELWMYRKDGMKRLMRIIVAPWYNDNMLEGSTFLLLDITEERSVRQKLEESQERFRNVFDYAPDTFYIMDMNGVFLDGNFASEALLKAKREDLIGKNFQELDIFAEGSLETALGLLERNLSGRNAGPDEIVLKRSNGELVNTEICTIPVTLNDKRVILGIARDISQRKEAERALAESEEKYSTLVENSKDGIVIIEEGRFIFANRTTGELLDIDAGELMGKEFFGYIDPGYREMMRDRYTRRLKGEDGLISHYETALLASNGKSIPVEIDINEIMYGGKKVHMVFLRNISERKRAERERESFIEELKKINEELQRADKLKDQFLSITSHELRSPLSAIIGVLDILKRGLYDSKGDLEDFLDTSYKTSQDMLATLNDLLDLTKIEAGKMEVVIMDVNIVDLFDDVYLLYSRDLENKGILLEIETVPDEFGKIRGDPMRIRQVLNNLVGNARKFTNEGSIRIWATGGDGEVVITVQDTGIGVPPEHLDELFQPFSQLHMKTKKEIKGTGLGLAISKSLVETMGGRIWIESEGKGRGTSVKFTLPLATSTDEHGPGGRDDSGEGAEGPDTQHGGVSGEGEAGVDPAEGPSGEGHPNDDDEGAAVR